MLNETNIEVLGEEQEEDIIEELSDPLYASTNLDFLNGDNTSLYLGFKAYHQDQDFEAAVSYFQQALAYSEANQEDTKTSQSGSIDISEPDDSQAKSKYWLAESYLKLEKDNLAINLFEDLISHHKLHYLSLAAERRLAILVGIHTNKD